MPTRLVKQRCSSKVPTGLVVLWNGPPDGSSGDTRPTKYWTYENRTFSGQAGTGLARDLEEPDGSTARIRKPCPEIMVRLDPFYGQSGQSLLLFGYARVSTDDQTLDLQRDALRVEGCERVFEDTASDAGERPALRAAFDHLRTGDSPVVRRLDRLGRSLGDLIERAGSLGNRGIGLRSLKEAIDTDSSGGRLVFLIFGALAEFERALVRERTQAGLAAARWEAAC